MKILDRFVSKTGVEVTLSVWLSPFGRSTFQVETNSEFINRECFFTYNNAFDTFFDIVEHLR